MSMSLVLCIIATHMMNLFLHTGAQVERQACLYEYSTISCAKLAAAPNVRRQF